MVVQHNITAMNANRYYGINNSKLSKSLEKLSSGYAINRAGDNAAGLAVSEKMRSQIAGMTQGVKNAQDGISMVQTFEGALTETQSILQRMKTLADQSANGTYQDDVDRDAIQLEFDQLNDELNQIADTDYNGVVVLNGGKMADGTVAKDGKFDYTLGYTTEVMANAATDISGAQAHTIVDQTFYDKDRADAVWSALGVDVADYDTLNVTFMYDGERWVSQTVTDSKENVIAEANAAKLEARTVDRDKATGLGGFEVVAGKDPTTGEDIIATNAIFDENKSSSVNGEEGPVKEGDTITIKFTNTAEKTYAPDNAGIDEETYVVKPTDTTKDILSTTEVAGKISFNLDSSLTDGSMTAAKEKALDEIANDLKFTVTYTKGVASIACTGNVLTTFDTDTGEIKDKTDPTIVYGTVKAANITQKTDAQAARATAGTGVKSVDAATLGSKMATTLTAENGTDVTVTMTYDHTVDGSTGNFSDFKITLDGITSDGSSVDLAISHSGNSIATLDEQNAVLKAYGIELSTALTKSGSTTVTYTPAKSASDTGEVATANGTVEFGLNIDSYNVVDLSKVEVHAIATPEVGTMKYQVAQQGVSVSNAYSQGSAPLTYTDNITLQTGARGKDAVNFTFKYTSGGIGNLKSNMDCSARENGLNTENLSLATAKDANYAIDQIDNAINKVSMVRGTFGAIQNRLEHKIDNMNVSIENLTDAESKIRDTDMSTEMMNFTKNQILAQAAQSMLAQANTLPQNVLSLLQ